MIKPLAYGSGISYAEAVERLDEVRGEFKMVRANYSGFFRQFKREMNLEDIKTLVECMGVLTPLSLERCIQDETEAFYGQRPQDTIHNQIGKISDQIAAFCAKYKNTGVTRLEGGGSLT